VFNFGAFFQGWSPFFRITIYIFNAFQPLDTKVDVRSGLINKYFSHLINKDINFGTKFSQATHMGKVKLLYSKSMKTLFKLMVKS
jgi:hypothetical protein